jgi:hypothetical protein
MSKWNQEGEVAAPELKPDEQVRPAIDGALYRLTMAFPSWAGGLLAIYALCLGGWTALKIRAR